jgi:hypothetical protein
VENDTSDEQDIKNCSNKGKRKEKRESYKRFGNNRELKTTSTVNDKVIKKIIHNSQQKVVSKRKKERVDEGRRRALQ